MKVFVYDRLSNAIATLCSLNFAVQPFLFQVLEFAWFFLEFFIMCVIVLVI